MTFSMSQFSTSTTTSSSKSLLTSSLLLILVLVVILRRYRPVLRDIPGPFLASFTRLWHVYHIFKGDHSLELMKLHDANGHFVRISHNEVSVSHPDGIMEILLTPLYKATWYKIMAIPDYRFQTPFSTVNPKAKKQRSKAFAPAYSLSNILRSEDAIDSLLKNLKSWMDHVATDHNAPIMHLDKFLSFATFDIAGQIIFSKPFGFLKSGIDLDGTISRNGALNLHVAVAGFFRWLHVLVIGNPLLTMTGLLPMGRLYNTAVTALNERQSDDDDDAITRFDMVEHWLRAYRENPEVVSMRDIYAHVTNAVGAGLDTVSIGVQSFIYHLIRNPAALEKIHQELKLAQDEEGRCGGCIVSYADAQRLPFLQACIKESLRMFNPIGMGLARVAGGDGVRIGDVMFPEGTILSVNPWVMHGSKELWGEDADEFLPERWFREDIASRERFFIPFGAGYGMCPGQNLAKVELSKFCATIARDYDIVQVHPAREWKWKARVTVMQHSWPVTITKRG